MQFACSYLALAVVPVRCFPLVASRPSIEVLDCSGNFSSVPVCFSGIFSILFRAFIMMGSRRSPFQYSTIDPAKRQEELQKRFGLHSPKKNMLVDLMNPISYSNGHSSPSGSPRLQHRIPVFVEETLGKPMSIDSSPKPRVRVIPIEIEDADSTIKRHKCASAPVTEACECEFQTVESPLHPKQCPASPKAPTVSNIPIKVEHRNSNIEFHSPTKATIDIRPPSKTRNVSPKVKLSGKENVKKNVCATSKSPNEQSRPEKMDVPKPELQPPTDPHSLALRKIDFVMEKLKGYETEVRVFAGTVKDKKYKYLDEMLTRCMLDLDNVETLGKEDVRLSRKTAVKKVQACVDLLETKVNATSEQPSEDNSTIDSTVLDEEPAEAIIECVDQRIVETVVQPVTITNLPGTDIEMKRLHEKPAVTKVNECVEHPIIKTVEKLPAEQQFVETNTTVGLFEMDKSNDSVEISSDTTVAEVVDSALHGDSQTQPQY